MNDKKSNGIDAGAGIADNLNRHINYLRLSITDRCNYSCLYCCGGSRQKYIPHGDILRYEEMQRVVGILWNLGVRKVRITGGEPLARKGAVEFMAALRKAFPDLRLALTTNGALLERHINALKSLNLDSVNISLDSWRPQTFALLTQGGVLAEVRSNIDRLLEADIPVKINSVALRGVSDEQLDDYLAAIRSMPIDLRFIEFMPMGANTIWNAGRYLSCSALRELVQQKVRLRPVEKTDCAAGPARMYSVAGFAGRLGFISAVSEHFCGTCNRLRLTANGDVRTCLFSDRQYHLRGMLRNSRVSDSAISLALTALCLAKPVGAKLLNARERPAVAAGQMVGIGG